MRKTRRDYVRIRERQHRKRNLLDVDTIHVIGSNKIRSCDRWSPPELQRSFMANWRDLVMNASNMCRRPECKTGIWATRHRLTSVESVMAIERYRKYLKINWIRWIVVGHVRVSRKQIRVADIIGRNIQWGRRSRYLSAERKSWVK